MPTYQYRCTECGENLEAVQKFTDAALTECPNCGGPLRKIFNAVGVVFKGSGFYRTDSRAKVSDGSSTNGSEKSESSNGSEKSDSGSTEKTPDKSGATAKSESAKPANSSGTKQTAPAGSSSTGSAS